MRRLVLLLSLLCVLAACTQVFFQPDDRQVLTPGRLGLRYDDVYFHAADGTRLHGWFLPARKPARGTVLFLHGNAQNISTHIVNVYWLPARGFNVFLFDYRGYGESQGTPTLAGMQDDIESALRLLLSRADVDTRRIVVFGQSLGGALAIYAVAHSPYRGHIRALIVDSAFADYRGIAREKLAGLWLTWPLAVPLSWTINDDYSPLRCIRRVSPIPLLIIQGDRDRIVPPHHARELFAAAAAPKELWMVPGAGHIGALHDPFYRDRLVAYLKRVLAARREGRRPAGAGARTTVRGREAIVRTRRRAPASQQGR